MGKNGGSSLSWLSAVKKAFRSPNKGNTDKRSCRSEDVEQQEQEKRRGKRRWIFGKSSVSYEKEQNHTARTTNNVDPRNAVPGPAGTGKSAEDENRRAIEVAIATTAAAEAAVATAQAAVQFIRRSANRPGNLVRENQAATVIQKAFRGYLARRALNALKGLVKLQALVRGHNVRKRTTLTLARMHALIRVQAQVCDQRRRLSVSREGSLNSSNFTDRNPKSKDGDSDEEQSVEKEIDSYSMPGLIKAAERDLAYAFSDKIWRCHMVENSGSEEQSPRTKWTDNCRETNQWERPGRYSCDQRTPVKIVQVDNAERRDSYQHIRLSSYSNCPQLRKSLPTASLQSPTNSYRPQLKYLQVHSASPRCIREEESMYPKSQTPNLGSFQRRPSYMAETESAKARIRSHSVPRQQRPSTPEREAIGIAKRRLFFGPPDDVASPSSSNMTRMQR